MNCNNDEKSTTSMEVPCFLIGLTAGVILTLLYAPMSGKSTRRLIERRAQKGKDWVQDQAHSAGEFVSSHTGDLRDRVMEVAGRH